MANDTNNIWLDSTFTSPLDNKEDVDISFTIGDSDNIGSYSFPVVYTTAQTIPASTDIILEYFNEVTSVSGVVNISSYYYVPSIILSTSLFDMSLEYNAGDTTASGYMNYDMIYFTGYNVVSGSLNNIMAFTAGLNIFYYNNVPIDIWNVVSISGGLDYWANYTNFSGNIGPGGIPVPYYTTAWDIYNKYNTGSSNKTGGDLNNVVDVTFAGWVNFPFLTDIYSSYLGFYKICDCEATTISGNVAAIYGSIYSSSLRKTQVLLDVYSCLHDLSLIYSDVETRDGRIGFINSDLFSCNDTNKPINMEVNLYSLKITNFSLDVGEYTTASGFITVDVVDDTCPISASGTYMFLNGFELPISFEIIENGYRLKYDPDDDFTSIDGPSELVVHTENECGDWIEDSFYLTIGIVAEYENYKDKGLDFYYGRDVLTRISAEDTASCPSVNSYAWTFRSRELVSKDLSASIFADSFGSNTKELSAEIYPLSTAYFYGREFKLVLNAQDFSGNTMETFVLNYKIENKT